MAHIDELFEFDKSFNKIIIGTDEAGRGSAVGSVFSAAVCFEYIDDDLIDNLCILNDSKKLSSKQRNELYKIIKYKSANSVCTNNVEFIEKYNILNASLYAMKQAVECVQTKIDKNDLLVIVDGSCNIPDLKFEQQKIVKGDSNSASIAAASILAKVERDNYMQELDKQYPEYNWKNNMGYLTPDHLEAIDKYGLTPLHRATFLEKYFAEKAQLKLF